MKQRHNHPPRPATRTAEAPVATADAMLQQALAHHRAGRLPQAEALYREILLAAPDHLDALYLLGVIAFQVGQYAAALDFTDRALACNAGIAEVHTTRANALAALQRYAEAVAGFDTALRLKPELAEAHNDRGNALHGLGQYAAAVASFDRAIALQPEFAAAHANRGNSLNADRQYQAALASLDRAIALNPHLAEAHSNRGNSLYGLGQFQAAVQSFEHAIGLRPDYVEAHRNLGNSLAALRQFQAAVESYDRAIADRPTYSDAWNDRANALHALDQFQAALVSCDRALQLQPGFAQAWCCRGNALAGLGQLQPALECFDRAIALQPGFAEAYTNRGNARCTLHEYPAAIADFDRAIALQPEFAEAFSNRSTALHELGQLQAALESIDRAVRLRPGFAQAWSNRGNSLHALQRYAEAVESLDAAIRLQPDLAEAYNNRGNSRRELQQFAAAVADFDTAIRLKPGFAEAYSNRGDALHDLKQYAAAIESFDRAIALNPGYAEAYANRGNVRQYLQQFPQALQDFDSAFALNPELDYLAGMRLYMKRLLCDWENIEAESLQVETGIARGKRAIIPFSTLAIYNSNTLQRTAGETYARQRYSAAASPLRPYPAHDRIRIGYYSADFHTHAICNLMAEVFERHDKQSFQIFAFSFDPHPPDPMRVRVVAAMDQFLDVCDKSDSEIVQLSRELEIDIAIDLMGFTEHCRPAIFARRAAPIQVNYLGYPASMGADFMDYILADRTIVPESARADYSEKIASLPDTFQANDSTTVPSANPRTRAEEGLPEHGFVFCCFNNCYKIAPGLFDIWMRILHSVPGSVLWLLEDNQWVAASLRREAASRGIAPERLVFAQRVLLPDHLVRQQLADLFLDTLPFNAGATASPALRAGLPILTCMGQAFAGRMAASLLRAVDLPELVTTTPEAYESLAIELALNPARLLALRERLARNRTTTPLFDTARFTRNLEAAYTAVHARVHAGLPPDHIHIEPVPPPLHPNL